MRLKVSLWVKGLGWGFRIQAFRGLGIIGVVMDNPLEKKMDNEMETTI